VIPDAPLLLLARLVGGDVESLVDLARVRDDDLAADRERKLECER
jgi:hypothetical protein